MKKLIAIATASCMLMAASAPAFAAPAVDAAPAAQQSATQSGVQNTGVRNKLIQRAAATARGQRSKFLGLGSIGGLLVGIGSLFSLAVGANGAAQGGNPGSA